MISFKYWVRQQLDRSVQQYEEGPEEMGNIIQDSGEGGGQRSELWKIIQGVSSGNPIVYCGDLGGNP